MKKLLSLIFVLSVSCTLNAQHVLFLDAGHGGKDPGVVASTGVSEAEINQLFANEIQALAEAKGIKVVMLNDGITNLSLNDRVKKVQEYKLAQGEYATLISIHANYSAEDPKKSGVELMVLREVERSAGSMELAKKMQQLLGGKIIEKGLTILRNVNMPAILVEAGYLSNEQESLTLQQPDMRTLMARKIVEALQ